MLNNTDNSKMYVTEVPPNEYDGLPLEQEFIGCLPEPEPDKLYEEALKDFEQNEEDIKAEREFLANFQKK